MKIREMYQAVNLLYQQWDLGKTPSQSKGKICAWIYFMGVLEESESLVIKKDGNKLIGFAGYAKWDSNKGKFRKKFASIIKWLLFHSPTIKDKEALKNYHHNYDYTPKSLENEFDGEVSIAILNPDYQKKGYGKQLLTKIFLLAKMRGIKNLQILTDESCNYSFYEHIGCHKVYETIIQNLEPHRCGNKTDEIAYIFEKKLDE